jgi:ankyrin repeat protein
MAWEGLAQNGDSSSLHTVSINAVDVDGNAAVHLAASSGLLECVHALVKAGAIISLVNVDQQTCCELADGDDGLGGRPARLGNKSLADALEAALVFQPVDDSMVAFQASMMAAGQVINCPSHYCITVPEKPSSNVNTHTHRGSCSRSNAQKPCWYWTQRLSMRLE